MTLHDRPPEAQAKNPPYTYKKTPPRYATCQFCPDVYMRHPKDRISKTCPKKTCQEKRRVQALEENRARIKKWRKANPTYFYDKRKPKPEKRRCNRYGKVAHCLGWIDNANERLCSVCHRELSDQIAEINGRLP